MINKKLKISRLIAKERIEKLSTDEHSILEEWKSEPANAELNYEITDQQSLTQRLEFYDNIDHVIAWQQLDRRINPVKRKLFIRNLSKWAAVLILPIITGYYFYNYYDSNKFQRFIDKNISYDSKAVLLTDKGETIDLEKIEKSEILVADNITAINSQNQLKYNISDPKNVSPIRQERYFTAKTSQNINGEYSFVLSDGSKVWLNSNTEFKHPIEFLGNVRKVYLKGEAQFEVAKDSSRPFIVVTENMEIEVLGTHFNVKTDNLKNLTQTTLVEGSVKVRTSDMESLLKPGQQAQLELGKELIIKDVNTMIYTSWVRGIYMFNNERLVDITTKLHQWYGVNVFFESELTKKIRFTGALNKNEPIDNFIKMLEKTSSVKFSIVESALVISK